MAQVVNVPGVGQLSFPDGMSQDDMASAIQKNFPQVHSQSQKPVDPTEDSTFGGNLLAGIGKGVTDLGLGVKQRFDEAASYLEQKLGTKGLNAILGLPNADDILRGTQDAIAEKRKVDAPLMKTAGGKTGEFIAQTVPAVAASLIPGGQTLAGTVLTGAAQGLAQPTTDGESVAGNVLTGAAGGAAGYGVTKALSRVVAPNAASNAELKLLREEGVTPTIGQTLGGFWNSAEQKLQSVPILGDAISAAKRRAIGQFDNAAINRATAPIGTEVNGYGQSAVKEAGDILSKAYDDALNRVGHVKLDDEFAANLDQLVDMTKSLVPAMSEKFDSTLSNVLMSRVTKQGVMLGDTYKAVDSELGQISRRYMKSPVASEGEFGEAVFQLKNLLNEQMQRSNPQLAGEIKAIDEGWANLVRIEAAAKAGKNASGMFTPAQLNTAIQTADDSIRKRAVSRGTALMQDLGNAGQSVLGGTIPDSGTAGRLLLGGGTAIATGLANPAIPVGLGVGALAYSRPIQSILNSIITARPESARMIGDAIGSYASRVGAGTAAEAIIRRRDNSAGHILRARNVDDAIREAQDLPVVSVSN